MRSLILILALLLLFGLAWAQNYQFVTAKSGKDLSLDKLAKQLVKYDVIFFGEFHGDPNVHAAQRELLPLLHAQDPRLILSFEMFERDVQGSVDEYLEGKISEQDFLAASRPWSNYETDYRPLVEFAKSKQQKAIAANVPRRLAGKAARGGRAFFDDLTEEDKVLMALQVHSPDGAYKQRFLETMQGNGVHGDPNNTELYDNMYLAQCLKDDTMAESIVRYLELFPKHRVIHFNGDFHSREFLGTVERLLLRSKKIKVAVIAPLYDMEKLPSKAEKIATYLLKIPTREEP